MKKKNSIPQFASEQEERAYWQKHDSAAVIDWSNAKRAIFSELKPTTQSISIRLPESLLTNLKVLANKKDVPYQSLLKTYLEDRVSKELQ
ncbi:hypothetical protein CO180_04320 [candidate division WWE3 bacterium CG_4_9_14_3_um_filter_41_6]|uniref:Antitoxin n=1 Tax=candidate division WWE3 bacterium CG_4_10_14_0_2_um_filter_41_14 TaxID=1975072 RepID=A0A2M7TLZ0_UNCKA|nr:MAG: hypothetical protein COY32_00465 [candidate division WWE3 bacterium CG_4_10_14_0_2_um_filter_41_14]PJA38085.1 MAG: hypothetical protein CO180_04320 [candidate division WWE3 bacterium CG_4_9_14_3_um_filter_41_6]